MLLPITWTGLLVSTTQKQNNNSYDTMALPSLAVASGGTLGTGGFGDQVQDVSADLDSVRIVW